MALNKESKPDIIDQESNSRTLDFSSNPKTSIRKLTLDDSKVLGRITKLRRSKSTSPQRKPVSTPSKTLHSSWTPTASRATNESIYQERIQLIGHWYDLWTDSQRKRFLEQLLENSSNSQHVHVRDWFDSRIPLQHVDFTRVLPRFLSIKIFSYLDPRSLSRAAKVSWNWKSITEQDNLWIPKCKKYGWYLPYSPSENELGAWKRHYIACTLNLDKYAPSSTGDPVYGQIGDGSVTEQRVKEIEKKKSLTAISHEESELILSSREPWFPPSKKPKDLERARQAIFAGYDPNQVQEETTVNKSLVFNDYGQVDTHKRKANMKATIPGFGLDSAKRKDQHRISKNVENLPGQSRPQTLTNFMEMERFTETQLRNLIEMPWDPPKKRITDIGPNLSGGGSIYPLPWQRHIPKDFDKLSGLIANYPGYSHPRVVFISSRVPAAEMLVDAVMFGVVPIVYEYESTTLSTLLFRLQNVLQGRLSQSIGIFGHHSSENEIRLVRGNTLNFRDLDHPEVMNFIRELANHTLPGQQCGHIDLFTPLAAFHEGTEILMQLQVLTDIVWTSPMSILEEFEYVNSEWSDQPEGVLPPTAYFDLNKLAVWSKTANMVDEAIKKTNQCLSGYFDQLKKDLNRQVTGQILFDALGQTNVIGSRKIGEHLLAGLIQLDNQTNIDPLIYLAEFLLKAAGETVKSVDTQNLTTQSVEEDSVEPQDEHNQSEEVHGKHLNDARNKEVRKKLSMKELQMSLTGQQGSRGPIRLTSKFYADHPEKRTPIAQEILASEVSYLRCLESVRDCLVNPLKRSLESNRAVLAMHQIQIIFTDLLILLDQSRTLTADLRARVRDWDSNQCIGDVFIKFSAKLKAYSNYFLNYPNILSTLQRCIETLPSFRNFLSLRECQPEMRMQTLQEILTMPTKRLGQYVSLLSWFLTHTPVDHPDCNDIREAVTIFKKMNSRILCDKERVERDRELVRIQKMVTNCPLLLEANRYLLMNEDVALLVLPSEAESIHPDYRIYQHVEDCGLILLSDALITTRKITRPVPYERVKEFEYIFESSVALNRLSVVDIADTKYIRNAFKLKTYRRKWIFGCVSDVAKHRLVEVLERAIRTALDNSD